MRNLSYNFTTVEKYARTLLSCAFLMLFLKSNLAYANNTTASAMIAGMGCYGNMNYSLGASCEAIITPGVMLESDTITESLYSVMVKDENGNLIPNATITSDHIGKKLSVSVKKLFGDGNSCWGYLTVEDKYKPELSCTNDTIYCNQNIDNIPLPEAEDNCDVKEVVLLNFLYHPYDDPCDEVFIGYYARESQAVDYAGNKSAVCFDTIFVRRIELEDIDFPIDTSIACDLLKLPENINPETGFPLPKLTGVPTLDGISLDPFVEGGTICMTSLTYDDELVFDNGCMKKIKRIWIAHQWTCPDGYTSIQDTQEIAIIDTIPPTIEPIADITAYAGLGCIAMVNLPAAVVSDNCKAPDDIEVKIRPEAHSEILSNGPVTIEYPVGEYEIIYEAYDGALCESSADTFIVTVVDNLEPNVLCKKEIVVSLANGWGSLPAEIADNGSSDDCGGKLTYKVKRTEDGCGEPANVPLDEVHFCCEDAGKTIMVTLEVTDESGNVGSCMISVIVQDKTQPRLVCPNDITISCGDDLPEEVLSLRGESVCPIDTLILVELDSMINGCGEGHIERKFILLNNNNRVDSCTQWIQVEGSSTFTEDSITWPVPLYCALDGNLMSLPDSVTLVGINQGNCQMAEEQPASIRDSILPDGAMFDLGVCDIKIRTVSVLDICSDNLFTFDQVILIKDTISPTITITIPTIPCIDELEVETMVSVEASISEPALLTWSVPEIPAMGTGSPAEFVASEGSYSITFTAVDSCGNESSESLNFDVETCVISCCDEVSGFTGMAVITCMGLPDGHPEAPAHPAYNAAIYDVRQNQDPSLPGTVWDLEPERPQNWIVDSIGQVFSIAVDTQSNVYLGATDVYDVLQDPLYDPTFVPAIGDHPGRIFKATPQDNFRAELFVDLPNTGGRLNGVGDIVYDKKNNQFFATNLEDGKIYRINESAIILDTYDPFAVDDNLPNIAPQEEQLWGLGVLQNDDGSTELYFARIDTIPGSEERNMYSIALNGENFPAPGSEIVRFENIPGGRNIISDIAFSKDGAQMLISERGHSAGANEDAHDSQAFRFSFDAMSPSDLNWNFDFNYFAGTAPEVVGQNFNYGESAAGGVSFGFTNDGDNVTANCDDMVWVSHNFARKDTFFISYGIEGIDVNGNGLNTSIDTDIFIDFDGVIKRDFGLNAEDDPVFSAKGQIGDVEVFSCGPQVILSGVKTATIAGQIKTIDHINVEEAMVSLISKDRHLDEAYVASVGGYDFGEMSSSGSYELVPFKDGDDANGVSTLDIIYMQRHILGIDRLDNPYDIIAADINNDQKITSTDLVQLRRLILGSYDSFPDNTSWRFLNAKQRFINPQAPWTTPLQESHYIDELDQDVNADFTGIKIGDVNGTVFNNVSSRGNDKIKLTIQDRMINAGENFKVVLRLDEAMDIYGYQFALNIDGAQITNISDLDDSNIKVDESGVVISWNSLNSKTNNQLFTLEMKASHSMFISEMLHVNNDKLSPEVYTGLDLQINQMELEYVKKESENSILHQNRPNPFSQYTDIDFELENDQQVTLRFMDISGRILKTMRLEANKGANVVRIDKSSDLGLRSGTVIYELITKDQTQIKKMILVD